MVALRIGDARHEFDHVATVIKVVDGPVEGVDFHAFGTGVEAGSQAAADLYAFHRSGWKQTEGLVEKIGGLDGERLAFLVKDRGFGRYCLVTPRVVVKLRSPAPLPEELTGVRLLDFSEGLWEAKWNESFTLGELADRLSALEARAEWSEPVLLEHFQTLAHASSTSVSKSLSNDVTWPWKLMGLEEAWKGASGEGVRVAVVDLGFWTEHPNLSLASESVYFSGESILKLGVPGAASFPNHWHGTACASIVAGRPSKRGIRGVGPKAIVVAIALEDATKSQLELARAFSYAAHDIAAPVPGGGAQIISCSLGPIQDPKRRLTRVLETALDFLSTCRGGRGVPVFWATSHDGDVCLDEPLRHDLVVSVAAVNRDGAKTGGWGPCLDILAPGVDVCYATTSPHRLYQALGGGPSFAAPAAAGIAALMLEVEPDLSAADLIHRLQVSGDQAPRNDDKGHGIPNAAVALRM